MQLDKEAIDEFKSLYLHEYGIKPSDSQALDYGMRLTRLVKGVYGKFSITKKKRINAPGAEGELRV